MNLHRAATSMGFRRTRGRHALTMVCICLAWSSMLPVAQAAEDAANKGCRSIAAQFPLGIAKNAKAAIAAVKAGQAKPAVDARAYARASNLDEKSQPRGYVCTMPLPAAKQRNARGFFALMDTYDSQVIRAHATYAAPGSDAARYVDYFAKSNEAYVWSNFASKGLVIPQPEPAVVVIQGDNVTVTQDGEVSAYAVTFDEFGRLQTWSTAAGPLASRLFAVSGTGTGVGVTTDLQWNYRTNRGSINAPGTATNASGRPLRLNTATYRTPDGSTYSGFASQGCIPPGQTVPMELSTTGSASAGGSGTWAIEVLDCDYFPIGNIDLSMSPRP